MLSAFGVDHGEFSKAESDTVDDMLTPLIPGSTVRAYDNSRRRKKKAALENFAVKTAGAAAGFGAGTLLARATRGRIPRLVANPSHSGYYTSLLGTGTAGIGGGVAGSQSLKSIKRDKQYRYKER